MRPDQKTTDRESTDLESTAQKPVTQRSTDPKQTGTQSTDRTATGRDGILVVATQDLASPLGVTVPYYLTTELSESHTVHAICRRREERREVGDDPEDVRLYAIDTGEVPVLSGVLYVLSSTLLALFLGVVNRYDAVYAFQTELVQGWVGSRAAGARFVVGLQSVPVRQFRDFVKEGGTVTGWTRVSILLFRAYGLLVRRVLESATEVVCLTEGIRDVTEEVFDVDLSRATVIGMGIDSEWFATNGAEPPVEPSATAWTITYLGTIHGTRGLDDAIEGIAATDHEVELLVAGGGSDAHISALEARARELGVEDRVRWLGMVPHDDVPSLLTATDVAISPLADIESYRISFPAKLLEYMAAGCVVLATDIEPHRRLIDDGINGYLHANGPDGFRAGLDRCLADADRHDEVRERATETAVAHDWDHVVAEHEGVIFP